MAMIPGVACIHQWHEVSQEGGKGGNGGEVKPSAATSTPGVALSQQGTETVIEVGKEQQKVLKK